MNQTLTLPGGERVFLRVLLVLLLGGFGGGLVHGRTKSRGMGGATVLKSSSN